MRDIYSEILKEIELIEGSESSYGHLHQVNLAIRALGGERQFKIEDDPHPSLIISYVALLSAKNSMDKEQSK